MTRATLFPLLLAASAAAAARADTPDPAVVERVASMVRGPEATRLAAERCGREAGRAARPSASADLPEALAVRRRPTRAPPDG